MIETESPLVITLNLDEDTFRLFNTLRQQHFPTERNHLDAHLTLFHQLPGSEIDQITADLQQVSERYRPIGLSVKEVRLLGRGVAYRLESQLLQQLHRQLQKQWQTLLTPQDQSKLWPHVTIQNKVDTSVAQLLHEQLATEFEPFGAVGTGLHLWEYRGGPWKSRQEFEFEKPLDG